MMTHTELSVLEILTEDARTPVERIAIMTGKTPEEIAEIERHRAEQTDPEPTPEERIAALEEELKAAKILLGLED